MERVVGVKRGGEGPVVAGGCHFDGFGGGWVDDGFEWRRA